MISHVLATFFKEKKLPAYKARKNLSKLLNILFMGKLKTIQVISVKQEVMAP